MRLNRNKKILIIGLASASYIFLVPLIFGSIVGTKEFIFSIVGGGIISLAYYLLNKK